MNGHKKSLKILYILLPVAIAAIYMMICLLIGNSYGTYALQKWNAMVIQGAPAYEYEQLAELYTTENISVAELIKQGKTPLKGEQYGKITCESIQLQSPLYYGDTDEILDKGAGTYMGGSLPDEGGTVLIGAHDTTFFAPLEQIKEGDILEISTIYGVFQYAVTKMKTGDMADSSMYELKNDGEELILYTCYPFGAVNEVRSQRYYIYADRISNTKGSEE